MNIPEFVRERQRSDRTDSLTIIKERMSGNVESIGLFTDERSKRGIDISFAVNLKYKSSPPLISRIKSFVIYITKNIALL